MVKIIIPLVVVIAASYACDKREPATSETPARSAPETSAQSAERASAQDPNPEGAATNDASLVQKGLAALDPTDAKATFQSAPDVKLEGKARLNQRDDGVHVSVDLSQGPPGAHGIHIHEKPDCSDIPGKSMGAHFAPENHAHGLPPSTRHLGDLGNIEIGAKGDADFEIVVSRANLKKDDRMSLLNRALVIHQKRDIGKGDSGESGKPIACATIVAD